MSADQDKAAVVHPRPDRVEVQPVPPIPDVTGQASDVASTNYSAYRTGLSNHRTGLSEHRTSLSEYRTDLSSHRTNLSTDRTEMSMRRTGMSFQRTRMSTDRTLMSIVRTSLSLIGFGFTIFQFFGKMVKTPGFELGANAPRNFGIALVALGMVLLTLGLWHHVVYMRVLRAERKSMVQAGLIHGESPYPVSPTLITAALLWLIGLFAVVSMTFNVAPFS
ncbi:hypothetical protein LYSHEL_22330 [Lysobacter helvus]|uniref:DUF202 domain-containing protein n=2 Tax=Lysobacteraceae TaxID=32033 RepID=A0ABM7Q727_9GAMM|nr:MULTISPECIES: DUF202 domain-containing protein [Lysobacter]BCT93210.1 hypothetical protein LYSCAS_22340 [Lysobacter caseinilyticus]BCT96362.1 hypothetical protein LYSHEL_22330 [Lysobacter helvus]